MKVVASYPHALTAHMARQHLQSAGIKAVVLDEHTHTALYYRIAAISGGVKVAVAPENAERAAAILKTLRKARPLRCPKCDSQDTRHMGNVALDLIVFAFTLGFVRPWRRCNDCDHLWRPKRRPSPRKPDG